MSDQRVKPRTPRGFRDLTPGEVLLRTEMLGKVRAVFERYGFSPLETPAIEHLDVLLGKYGEEGNKSIFRLETPEEEAVGLRFNLTVPLARYFAQNHMQLPRPFRRYQISPVWRGDKPDPGRFREFVQFDIDTVGSPLVAADVEILAAMSEAFAALGLGDKALLRVSSRNLLDVLVRYSGIADERAPDVFRVLDKLDKIGRDGVRAELTEGRVDASGDEIKGQGFASAEVDRIEAFLDLAGKSRAETVAAVASLLEGTDGLDAAVAELTEIDELLSDLGLGDDRVMFDVALARGLDYYTGPVFEAVLSDAPEFGSIAGGGRYDGLVSRFSGEDVKATGCSLGVDRLLDALLRRELVTPRVSTVEVVVARMDASLMREYQRMAAELRGAGIASVVYLGGGRNLKKQLAYADRLGARCAVLLGGDELERGEVTIKDLVEGAKQGADADTEDRQEYLEQRFAQKSVPRAELVATVREVLAR